MQLQHALNKATLRSEVGIRKLKNGLSGYVDRVGGIEEVIVIRQGPPRRVCVPGGHACLLPDAPDFGQGRPVLATRGDDLLAHSPRTQVVQLATAEMISRQVQDDCDGFTQLSECHHTDVSACSKDPLC